MSYIDIVFDGPPSHVPGRFVEVEDPNKAGVSLGEWIERDDGNWVLRIPDPSAQAESAVQAVLSICEWLESPDPIYWANREGLAKRIREQLAKNLQEES